MLDYLGDDLESGFQATQKAPVDDLEAGYQKLQMAPSHSSEGLPMAVSHGEYKEPTFIERMMERQRQKNLALAANPFKAALSEAGNIPVNLFNAGSLVRKLREPFSDTPLAIEKYLPDPTLAGIAEGVGNIPLGAGQMAGNLMGGENASRMNEAAQGSRQYFAENFVPSATGRMAGESIPFMLTGGASGAPKVLSTGEKILELLKAGGTGAVIGASSPDSEAKTSDEYMANARKRAVVGGLISTGVAGVGQVAQRLSGAPAVKDVRQLPEDITAGMLKSVKDDVAILRGVAMTGGENGSRAAKIADALEAAGDDPARVLQLSAQAKSLTEKVANDAAYSNVAGMLKGAKATGVPKTTDAIDQVIHELDINHFPEKEGAATILGELKNNLSSGKKELSYEALSQTRRSLKNKLRAIYSADPTGGEGKYGINSDQYKRIANALDADVDAMIQTHNPEAAPALAEARKNYAKYKEKWGNNPLNKALTQSEVQDELVGKFTVGSPRVNRAQNAAEAMTGSGVEATKAQMLQQAMDESGGEPAKLVAALKKRQDATSVFFTREDLQRLQGIQKINRVSAVAGEGGIAGLGGTAGAGMGPVGAVGGGLVGLAADRAAGRFGLSAAVPIAKVVRVLLMTKAGQKVLLGAKQYPKGSPEWEKAIMRGYAALSGAAAGEMNHGTAVEEPN